MAPLANTARSVVPAPMSTRHTPSSFSSSVSTAKLEASCSSTMSSTSSPQRWMHFSMFCAAESAPVTMCTLASSRTPDMPIGSRMPSWPSTRNSCGSTCRIFWSAGMATALAASITCSTSPCVTSLSRTPTTPWEFRLRTWLPAMPANTEWISQPAISSASSTARWMDCTVDSMFTTTPFLRPREGCDPRPNTSMEPSRPISPTSATTLEVPMSRPTMRFLSERLSIAATISACRRVWRVATPADRKTVCITHVYVCNVVAALSHEFQRRCDEFVESLIDLAAAEPHGDPVCQIELPGAAGIEPHCRQAQSRLLQPPLRCQITLRHFRLLAFGTGELRELRRDMPFIGGEQLAPCIQQAPLTPTGRCHLLDDEHGESARPGSLHAHCIHPRDRVKRLMNGGEIDAQQSGSPHALFHDALDVDGGYTLEAT